MAFDLPSLVFALLYGLIAVSFTVWCVGWFQRRSPRRGSLLEAPELKFVLVSAVAIPTCFATGYGLTRLPGVSKVL